jgi:hypothetical protein
MQASGIDQLPCPGSPEAQAWAVSSIHLSDMRNKRRNRMNKRFQKIALASAVTAALAGVSLPSQAIVVGNAGEALLVPLVMHDGGVTGLNTLIEIEVPASVGWEDVANIYTARHVTPTNPNLTLNPPDPDINAIHWFFFNHKSEHKLNGAKPVTPNDIVQINWRQMSGGAFPGEAGYMVVTNQVGYETGAGAEFSMFGNAWLVNNLGLEANIPVLPLTDNQDGVNAVPTADDNVIYGPNGTGGVVTAVSPLISGIRTTYSDGALGDFTVFDMPLSSPGFATYQVIWADDNLGSDFSNVFVEVYDTEENTCSSGVPVVDEVNIIKIAGGADVLIPTTNVYTPCLPVGGAAADGFISYQLQEYQDRGTFTPETSIVAFSIVTKVIDDVTGLNARNFFVAETALAFDRGMFQ